MNGYVKEKKEYKEKRERNIEKKSSMHMWVRRLADAWNRERMKKFIIPS